MRDKMGRFIKGYHSHPSTEFKKGQRASPKTEFKKGENVNEKHRLWKGDNVSYSGLHYWIHRKLGMPKICCNCGTIQAKKYEWANISGEYKRDLTDWIRLCKRCHSLKDEVGKKAWITRRMRYAQN